MSRFTAVGVALLLLLGCGTAQQTGDNAASANRFDPLVPIPVITGGIGVESTFGTHQKNVTPVIAPILLIPMGRQALVEAEFEAEPGIMWNDGKLAPIVVDKSLEYAQLDYLVSDHLTLVVGRFATPFNIYKERMDARWIRMLSAAPLIFDFSDNSNNGGEVRGNFSLSNTNRVTFIGYYSALTDHPIAGSEHQTGARAALVNAKHRIEIGMSYQRRLSSEQFNAYGTDFTWNVRKLPLDLRGESLISTQAGKGYWAEAAWRLSGSRYPRWLHRGQAVLRGEQFFAPSGSVDQVSADRVFAGWNYRLTDLLRVQAAYGRQFNSSDNRSLLTVAVNFRFIQ